MKLKLKSQKMCTNRSFFTMHLERQIKYIYCEIYVCNITFLGRKQFERLRARDCVLTWDKK